MEKGTESRFIKKHKLLLIIAIFFIIQLGLLPAYIKIGGGRLSARNTKVESAAQGHELVPEYDRFLKKVVMSLSVKDTGLEAHLELINAFPEYTQIFVLLPDSSFSAVSEELRLEPSGARTTLIPFPTEHKKKMQTYLVFPEKDKLVQGTAEHVVFPFGSSWTQDLFEVADRPDGTRVLLISDTHKWFASFGSSSNLNVVSDNSYLYLLSETGAAVERLELTFSGGNIMNDRIGDTSIVFYGGDVLRKTRLVWKSTKGSKAPANSKIAAMLKKATNADQVVVIGQEVQPALLFHLDQAMLPLPGGIMAVTNIVGELPAAGMAAQEIREVAIFLAQVREAALKRGYRLVDVDTSVANLLQHQYYINAIPFINAVDGQRTILMPFFADELVLDELAVKNKELFESLGFRVIPIHSDAYTRNGGIHCLVNVIE